MRFMTYNVRYDCPDDDAQGWGWNGRGRRVAALIRDAAPDVVGLQEALACQVEFLAAGLEAFDWAGVGRDDGLRAGEYAPVFYRKSGFEALDSGTFWLSPSPDVPGSHGWNTSHRRIVTWARLRERERGEIFCFFNTHFDDQSALARGQSTLLLKQKAAVIAGGQPAVIAGDFNCLSSDPVRQGFVDGTVFALRDALENELHPPTYRDFDIRMASPRNPVCSIDTLFFTTHWHLHRAFLDETHDGCSYPSDHVPVLAEASINH